MVKQFCISKEFNGVTINGILDETHLQEQSARFAYTMKEQYAKMDNPREEGLVTRVCKYIAENKTLRDSMPEYVKLVDLCLTMILGLVEDERVFSARGS